MKDDGLMRTRALFIKLLYPTVERLPEIRMELVGEPHQRLCYHSADPSLRVKDIIRYVCETPALLDITEKGAIRLLLQLPGFSASLTECMSGSKIRVYCVQVAPRFLQLHISIIYLTLPNTSLVVTISRQASPRILCACIYTS